LNPRIVREAIVDRRNALKVGTTAITVPLVLAAGLVPLGQAMAACAEAAPADGNGDHEQPKQKHRLKQFQLPPRSPRLLGTPALVGGTVTGTSRLSIANKTADVPTEKTDSNSRSSVDGPSGLYVAEMLFQSFISKEYRSWQARCLIVVDRPGLDSPFIIALATVFILTSYV
jgi:hypothetical protein